MARSGPKRLGILGGTFDPVHLGHLAVARAALEGMALDEILFVPSYKPPHKQELSQASFSHRLAMLRLALADEPRFSLSGLEGERQELSYTIDTLKLLHQRLGDEVRLFFIMGFDAFVEMSTWKRYAEIPGLADLLVINRPHAQQGSMQTAVHQVFGLEVATADVKKGSWQLRGGGQVHELTMTEVAISSSAIRQRLVEHHDVSTMLQAQVAAYIIQEKLYQK